MKLRWRTSFATLAVAIGFTAAACGGGSSGGTATVNSGGGGSAAVVSTHSGPPGTYLTDGKGKTLYMWKADTTTKSVCSGQCTQYWPAYTTDGAPTASGSAKAAMLGTSVRDDGKTQVTYAGHPLYYYSGDQKAGDTNGQGNTNFGNVWWIVAPNGTAITKKSGGSNGGYGSGYSY